MLAGEEDILRLDVAVDDLLPMRCLERASDRLGDAQRLFDRKLFFAIQPVAQ